MKKPLICTECGKTFTPEEAQDYAIIREREKEADDICRVCFTAFTQRLAYEIYTQEKMHWKEGDDNEPQEEDLAHD